MVYCCCDGFEIELDVDISKWYLMVFFKFHCEVDVRMSGVSIKQKSSSNCFTVKQGKIVIYMYISKPNGGVSHAFLF